MRLTLRGASDKGLWKPPAVAQKCSPAPNLSWDHWSELVSDFPWAQTRSLHNQALCLQGGPTPLLGCWAWLDFTVVLGLNDLKFLFFFFSEAGASDFCLTGIKWLTMLWIAYQKHFRTALSVPKSIQNCGFSAPANAGCLILQEIFLNIILNPNYSPKFWGVSSVWNFWLWVLNAAL